MVGTTGLFLTRSNFCGNIKKIWNYLLKIRDKGLARHFISSTFHHRKRYKLKSLGNQFILIYLLSCWLLSYLGVSLYESTTVTATDGFTCRPRHEIISYKYRSKLEPITQINWFICVVPPENQTQNPRIQSNALTTRLQRRRSF